MFDNFFSALKDAIGAKVLEVAKELEQHLAIPEAAGSFTSMCQFTPTDATIAKGGIAIVENGWQIEAYDNNVMRLNTTEPLRKVILFEVAEPKDSESILLCRFQAKALQTEKAISVQLCLCQQHSFLTTSKAWSTRISPTEDAHLFEVRAHFKQEQNPVKVQIIVIFESAGILQIKDIELLKAPVKLRS